MKFSCVTSHFLQALQLVSRAISGQQALPILQNILVEVEGKRCTVSATDLELSIVTSFEADVENEGILTISAKAIVNFAQYNNDPTILLESIEGTQLRCTSKKSKTLIAGEAASEYPKIATVEKKKSFVLEQGPLLNALNLVTFSCAKTTLRPVLSGVYVYHQKGALVFAATDSYRLSEYRLSVGDGEDISCIIPVKVLDELRMILSAVKKQKIDGEEEKKKKGEAEPQDITVTLSSQQIEFHIGSTRLISRLIDGKFPDYEQIIPTSSPTKVMLETDELLPCIKRMHYFAKEVNNTLTFAIGSGQVTVHTPATQFGRDESSFAADVQGGDTRIALSSTYLLDFLSHIAATSVSMLVADSMHPALFRIPGNDAFLHLIMPLRLQEE